MYPRIKCLVKEHVTRRRCLGTDFGSFALSVPRLVLGKKLTLNSSSKNNCTYGIEYDKNIFIYA